MSLIHALDHGRQKFEEDDELAKQYFERLREVLNFYQILPKYMYNFDETGQAMGKILVQMVLVAVHDPDVFLKKPGNREWCSSIECVGLYQDVPPFIVQNKCILCTEDDAFVGSSYPTFLERSSIGFGTCRDMLWPKEVMRITSHPPLQSRV